MSENDAGLHARFGHTVKHLREAQGWSQERLAEKSDLNRSYVGEIERGIAVPSLLTMDKIALALGLPLSGLIGRCESASAGRS